jgi:Zn-dependent alcohol dehydrogenase
VLDVPDPAIEEATDVIITVTSTAVCGSDLHLYGVLGAYLKRGDILGREAVGGVAEVGPVVEGLDVGDRVVSRSTSPAGAAGCVSVSCTYGARRRRCVAREMSGTSGRHLLRVGARRAGRVSARSSRLSSGRSRSRTARRPSTSATCPTSCRPVSGRSVCGCFTPAGHVRHRHGARAKRARRRMP